MSLMSKESSMRGAIGSVFCRMALGSSPAYSQKGENKITTERKKPPRKTCESGLITGLVDDMKTTHR